MKNAISATICRLLVVSGVGLTLAIVGHTQVQTESSTTSGQASKSTSVERGTVVLVSGNDLYVKAEDGSMRHFPNVPESTRVTVDGKQLGIHDLKPGMKLQRTITTTTTPQTVTTVQTVTGKVWHVNPPSHVILTLEDGTNQSFNIPKDQKFNVDGKMLDAFALKKGMKISATKVVETPVTLVSQSRHITGEMPPAPPADQPILVASGHPTPAPAPQVAEAAPAPELPKTGSELPLIGLLGMLCVVFALGARRLRRS